MNSFLEGAYDLHVHAHPSLFPRKLTASELTDTCKKAGMKGVAVKFHHGSSAEIAQLLNSRYSDFGVFGGICLNRFTGGLNPYSVDAALALKGKFVWLPTIHAEAHGDAMGVIGGFKFQMPDLKMTPPPRGISLLDTSGELLPEMREILDLLHETDAILSTGHVSFPEILAVKKFIRKNNFKIKMLIQHIFFDVPRLNEEQTQILNDPLTWFEAIYLTVSPQIQSNRIETVANFIVKHLEYQWIFSSDSGQPKLPTSPEAIQTFAELLFRQGIKETFIRQTLRDEAEKLLFS